MLDALRGLAIVIMVVDHVADLLFDLRVDDSVIRSATRLSMPLFSILMGYFFRFCDSVQSLAARFRPERTTQIIIAMAAVNLVFYPHHHLVDILASLLVAYLAYLILGKYFSWCVLLIIAYPIDPSIGRFDFPITIAVSFVAQGSILRQHGFRWALLSGLLLTLAGWWVFKYQHAAVFHKLFYFVLPATIMIAWAEKSPARNIPGLSLVGRYPLTAYVAQYYVIFLIAYLVKS